ncbi:hypothetical protein [Petrocella sp. FN5]|uniref:hypothetical protein n=1 Tax=Petrocella sp. FN5 TaxID=3032002 RepID=UPI0023DA1596|nr:hypothetical protein [Petrocella sp. FN5]MDF1617213.1 hypothetical protein [Petrocella sp. FN5]
MNRKELKAKEKCYANFDSAIEEWMMDKPNQDQILPHLRTENELDQYNNLPFVKNEDGNHVFFIDRSRGTNGRLVKANEFSEIKDINEKAYENLENHYSGIAIDFRKAGNSNIFKLDSTLFLGIARTTILIKDVQKAISEKFGDNLYYLISDCENLFVVDRKNNLESEIEQLDSFDEAWLECEFIVLKKDEKGKFTEEKVIKR